MNLIDTISDAPAVAMLGMSKNAGKTTAMNTIIRDYPDKGVLCVTSIGMDGESRDLVTGTAKPSIWIREGMLAATAERLLPFCDVSREILSATGINTSLGEVVIFRARSDGFVQLAGPSIVDQMGKLRMILTQFGTDCILIDGALNRKSPLAGTIDGVCILSAGASLDRDINKVVEETAYAVDLLCLPEFVGKKLSAALSGQIGILHKDGRESFYENPVNFPELSGQDNIFFPGALTESYGRTLLRNKFVAGGVSIVVKDASCLLLKRATWKSLVARGVNFFVQRRTNLAAVTVNPYSPEGWQFEPSVFLEKMRTSISVPVLDVLSCGGKC